MASKASRLVETAARRGRQRHHATEVAKGDSSPADGGEGVSVASIGERDAHGREGWRGCLEGLRAAAGASVPWRHPPPGRSMRGEGGLLPSLHPSCNQKGERGETLQDQENDAVLEHPDDASSKLWIIEQ